MKEMTRQNAQASLAGESQAHIKYLNFAERARKEGHGNVARLFDAAAYSEQIHASSHLKALDGVQSTVANLGAGVEGETFEIDEMYPTYIAVAEFQAEAKAKRAMHNALEAEKVHASLYRKASTELASGAKDIAEIPYYVCPVCGFTMEGEPPDVCPICGVKHDQFKKF